MKVLRILAFPVSLVYAIAVHIRNFLYDIGIFTSESFSTVIICIGNLSTGGTGKTPMVSFLTKLLEGRYKVAMLSRGYRRKSIGFLLANAASKVTELGDEPFQLYRKHPSLTVAVDSNRCNGIRLLQERVNPEIILLDDAFQHRKVRPHLSLLLTAYDSLYVDDWYLPTGNLRDAKNQSKRADVIVVTKCPHLLSKQERETITKRIGPKPHQKVIYGTLGYSEYFTDGENRISFSEIKNKKCILVTGIANPKPLIGHLKSLALQFKHLEFADHHFFTEKEISDFNAFEIVLTTEKDYVRLKTKLKNCYYIEVAHEFSESDSEMLELRIDETIRLHSVP